MLAAASEEFAQRGYANARVRQIVVQANANVAAINYHFGGKSGLYRATLEYLSASAGATLPLVNRRGRSPEDRLRRRIHGTLERFLVHSAGSTLGRILAHEAMNPSEQLDGVIAESLKPQLEAFAALLREIAPEAPAEDLRYAAIGVVGQCLLFQFANAAVRRASPGLPEGRALCRAASEHIARLTVAGLKGARRGFSCKAFSDAL